MKNRKHLLVILGGMLTCQMFAAQTNRPNILWIITDDQRADSLECYNQATTGKSESPLGYVSSPHADRLAAEGVLFTRAICNSPMCTPSRGSMQSGLYPFRRGQYRWGMTHQQPDFVRPTVSQTLRKEGYGTAVFGKTGWGIENSLNREENSETDFYDYTIDFQELQRKGKGEIFYSGGDFQFPAGIFTPFRSEETIMFPDGRTLTYLTQLRDEPMPERDARIKADVVCESLLSSSPHTRASAEGVPGCLQGEVL